MTYLARACRRCGRAYHTYAFWHSRPESPALCDACYEELTFPHRPGIWHLLPNPIELSPEPVVDWSAVPRLTPRDFHTDEFLRMPTPTTVEISNGDGTYRGPFPLE